MKIKKSIALFIYYLIAYNLPNYSFPAGRFFNWLRVICLKNIVPTGNRCRIMRKVYIGTGNNVCIGNNCRINEGVRLDNVKIGNHVMIARESIILGRTHEISDKLKPMEQQGNKNTTVSKIDDDVWLGLRVIIMPSIHIEKGSIIGAGAVVTKSTEENGIYAGVPAKLIKYR
ncbi:MAG: acyltransferase [Saprospiraceae bacterium]|nr:acyltransferase [Saprospiraceae bacterium]